MKDTLNIRLQPETDNKNWKENCKTIQKMAQKTDLYKRFNIGQNWYEKTERLYMKYNTKDWQVKLMVIAW